MIDFRELTWDEAFTLVNRKGPAALIEATRSLEWSDSKHERWPRYKTFDDATAAVLKTDDVPHESGV